MSESLSASATKHSDSLVEDFIRNRRLLPSYPYRLQLRILINGGFLPEESVPYFRERMLALDARQRAKDEAIST